jgi:hypothetical protein
MVRRLFRPGKACSIEQFAHRGIDDSIVSTAWFCSPSFLVMK